MQVPFFELTGQYESIRGEVDREVLEVLASGQFILGSRLEAFESAIAERTGAHAVGVASGTDAVQLALEACGVGPGDTVITVPNTATPTVCAIVATGARVGFVDVDPATYTMDPRRLAQYLERAERTERIKAVVPVHLYGQPADMAPILELAKRHGLRVIEDAAQAIDAEYRGRVVGTLGDAGCLSFYPTKNLGAYGDAGMVLARDREVAERVRRLRNYGEAAKNRNVTRGYNSRLDELQAAILRVKLEHLARWTDLRRELARLYGELLDGSPVERPVEAPWARHVYHLYVVRSTRRDELRAHLEAAGVATAIHYPTPIHHQEAYLALGYPADSFPEAVRASREILSLPLFPELSKDSVRHVCRAIRSFSP